MIFVGRSVERRVFPSFDSKTAIRQGSAVDTSGFASRARFACFGLQTSKTRQGLPYSSPFSFILLCRSITPSTPNAWAAQAFSRSSRRRGSGFFVSMDRNIGGTSGAGTHGRPRSGPRADIVPPP